MGLTFVYNSRHLLARRGTTMMTVVGIALVVFVFVATLMLANGLRETLAATGSPENAIVIRIGSRNEIQSGITREQANIVLAEPEVARDINNTSLGITDLVVIVSLKKRDSGDPSNVTIRGTQRTAFAIRDNVKLIKGRLPAPGAQEVLVGTAINSKFQGTDIGESIRLVGTNWPVVGIIDGGNTAFSSEIWGDIDILMPSFRRENLSSVTFRLKPGSDFSALKQRMENDPRLSVTVKREMEFYANQSETLAVFITYLGGFISIIFSLGAMIGAMITMYSAVANRTREIGILRILGFSRFAIFRAFAKECLFISFVGGLAGIVLASLLVIVTVSTVNFSTFAEVAFSFKMEPQIVAKGLLFALLMGAMGGILPAYRASRIKLVQAIRM